MPTLKKCSTGIRGLDEITNGGLPAGRPTLVCGGAGCGKTLLAMEFLVRGAVEHSEPGVFVSFEEGEGDLVANVASLGFNLRRLISQKKILLDYVRIERSEIEESGEYDLDGLFVRLGHAIDSIGARRVVLDTLEALFSGLSNHAILRAELRRLFGWLKDRGVTAIITGEQGDGHLTRHGLEEYVSDCVILLDHRVSDQSCTRRLRVVKYRGSTHGTNEFPFLIDERGITILPITSLGLDHGVTAERVSSGVAQLDEMLGGGFFRGTSILVSGGAGSGKTSVAASFADAACARGERVLHFAFEESPAQIFRNMRSIGLQLERHVRKGRLRIQAARPAVMGLEMHLVAMQREIQDFRPSIVIVDPATSLMEESPSSDAKLMFVRIVDFIKRTRMTALLTSFMSDDTAEEPSTGVSSIMDTWLLLRNLESGGERNRTLYLLKSRGMAHSNQLREFLITDRGLRLQDVYLGSGGVFTGSARLAQEARDRAEEEVRRMGENRRRLDLEGRKRTLEAQLAAVDAELTAVGRGASRRIEQETLARTLLRKSRRNHGD